ncbi:MAG: EAL domain-containing protein [Inhella sp.]
MKLALVEDSLMIREQLEWRFEHQPAIDLVGWADTEDSAVGLVQEQQPDVLLLDLGLRQGQGLRVLERVRAAGCGARVLVLTNQRGAHLREACLGLGALGFYDKTLEFEACLQRLQSWLPPTPDNELQRLAALQDTGLLDSEPQPLFDRLTRLAAALTDTPMALITLLDQRRQWFLSRQGLDAPSTSRSVSFCAHAILQHGMFEVSDARDDPRFLDNPLVRGAPHARFYAGVPLRLPTGEALGTLCVLDREPRQLSPLQREALETLAQSAVSEMELRRRLHHLQAEGQRRAHAEAHLHHLATRDPLTGLTNRTTLRDRLDQQLRLAQRHQRGLALIVLGLDRFKLINDSLGHDVGDVVLSVSAGRLVQALRDSDTVARLGADEFAVLVHDLDQPEQALALASKLLHKLAEPIDIEGQRLQAAASAGVALFPPHGESPELLLRHADLALLEAKARGGAQALLYAPQFDDPAGAALMLEQDLHHAIDKDELLLHFQPQLWADGRLRAVEALVRWQHPRLGLLGPDRFIPFAEERGLIGAIDDWVLRRALQLLSSWDALGLPVPRVAVNRSGCGLRRDLVERVDAALAEQGLDGTRLEIEITETALSADGAEALSVLHALRERQVSIAVDDFGEGYSSLGQLHRLPIDVLKIDRSFVRDIGEPRATAMVAAVLGMARALHLGTLAEGVEQLAQQQLLLELGCEALQGYGCCRPLADEPLQTWLRGRAAG